METNLMNQKKFLQKNKSSLTNLDPKGGSIQVIAVDKVWYGDLINWLFNGSKTIPSKIKSPDILLNNQLKKGVRVGIDFEVVHTNIWSYLTNIFSTPKQKIQGFLVYTETKREVEFVYPPQTIQIQFGRQTLIRVASLSWLIKEIKESACNQCHVYPSKSFLYHLQTNSKIDDSLTVEKVLKQYGNNFELRCIESHKLFSTPNSKTPHIFKPDVNLQSPRKPIQSINTVKTPTKLSPRPPLSPIPNKQVQKKSASNIFQEPQPSLPLLNSPISTPSYSNPVGLVNLGNTCFLNASLQCICRIKPLVSFILSTDFDSQININNSLGSKGKIARAFRNFLIEISSSRSAVNPSKLREAIISKYRRFSNFAQHDSQEFLNALIDGLHEDFNQPSKDKTLENADSLELHLSRNSSPIQKIFLGSMFSSIECPECGFSKIVRDPFMFFTVDVPKSVIGVRLLNCLKKFNQCEILDKDNLWECEKCGKKVRARKRMGLNECPNVLIIHLKRFSENGHFARKNETKVEYPDLLSSKDFMEKDCGDYNLVGVVCHCGGLNGGHYTAMALDQKNNIWYYFNDSIVKKISASSAHVSDAYVLFYQRI